MKKTFLLFPLVVLGLACLLGWAASRPSHSLDNRTLQKTLRSQSSPGPQPKAVVEQPEYCFGTLPPLTMATHEFVIRNDGDAPLTLKSGSTTCRCTMGEIADPVVGPGESGVVRLSWNTGSKYPIYAQRATVLTNDLRHPRIELSVTGRVRVQLGAEPAELINEQVEPDRSTTLSAIVYSQIWNAFEVEGITCSIQGATSRVEPAQQEAMRSLDARSAKRVVVILPEGMPEGFFQGLLCLEIQPAGQGKRELLEISISGKVLRRLAVYGPEVRTNGMIDLGNIPQGQGRTCRLLIKVRDELPRIRIREIQTTPDFLQASVRPYQEEAAAKGLYHLSLRVPPDAPACSHLDRNLGELRILIEHPRIKSLIMPVRFVIHQD